MTTLDDLFDLDDLAQAIDAGYVRVQTHPELSLRILNYTEKASYERVWNPVTLTCRGLIVNDTDEVVARPFRKFFNHGEPSAPTMDLDAPVAVTDKADGSLGILYPIGDGQLAVATRGSFTSVQAVHATKVWQQRYAHTARLPEGVTVLCEIVFPENRIVLDYGDVDELVLLGCVDIATGRTYGHEHVDYWPGPRVETFPYLRLAEALAAEPRPNAEGLVVHFLESDERLKLKQEWYIQQHRLITGLTARRLWERCAVHAALAEQPDITIRRLAQGLRLDPATAQAIVGAGPGWQEEIRHTAAEEFTAWIDAKVAKLHADARAIQAEVQERAAELLSLPRKEAAAAIAQHPRRGLIFAALDGKTITSQVWAAIYPEHEHPFYAASEDVA